MRTRLAVALSGLVPVLIAVLAALAGEWGFAFLFALAGLVTPIVAQVTLDPPAFLIRRRTAEIAPPKHDFELDETPTVDLSEGAVAAGRSRGETPAASRPSVPFAPSRLTNIGRRLAERATPNVVIGVGSSLEPADPRRHGPRTPPNVLRRNRISAPLSGADIDANPTIAGVPPAFFEITPELGTTELPLEKKSDCKNCPVIVAAGERPTARRPFRRDLKCCTRHPTLPNFLLGRALSREGRTADMVMRRIDAGDGVDLVGIAPSAAFKTIPELGRGFGTDTSLRCPYWRGGDLSCGVWEDRGAECRTWFCRHEDGPRSVALWQAVRQVMESVEQRLARWCVEVGEPPAHGCAPEEMADWYVTCAELVQHAATRDVAHLRDPALDALVDRLVRRAEAVGQRVPNHLAQGQHGRIVDGDEVVLSGYSRLHPVTVPSWVDAFMESLDPREPWRDFADEQVEPWIERLYRAGVLKEPGAVDDASDRQPTDEDAPDIAPPGLPE